MVSDDSPKRTTRPPSTSRIENSGRFGSNGGVKKEHAKKMNSAPVEWVSARVVLLFGAPGSGKGTQSSLLTSRFGIGTLSTGAMLRNEAKRRTPAGFRLRQTLACGALVSDELVCEIVASRIRALRNGDTLILDGFPRTTSQAGYLDNLLAGMGMPEPVALHLDVPREVLQRRLAGRRECATCGAVYSLVSTGALNSPKSSRCQFDGGALVERDDDSEGVIARRLAAFEAETLPVVECYLGRRYHRIDGNRPAPEIAGDLQRLLGFADAAVAA